MMKAHLNLSPVVVSLKCRRIDSIIRKKVKGRAGYENMYSVAKHLYMDNGEVFGNDTLTLSIVGMLCGPLYRSTGPFY